MNRDFQIRFIAILLALLTTAAVVYAGYNLQAERQFQVPDDGVWWVEHQGRLTADRVEVGGPGTRAGIKVGDQLTAIDQHEVKTTAARTHQLVPRGSLVEDDLLASAAIGASGCGADSGSGGAVPVQLAAAHWPDLPRHWAVRICCGAGPRPARPTSTSSAWFRLFPTRSTTPANSTGLTGPFTGATS